MSKDRLYFRQLLSGRDFAADDMIATQMRNFAYLIGDRQQIRVDSSEHFLFQNNQVAYRLISRVDGRPWLQSALTPHNNSSSTLSAFIQLATR